MYHKDQRINECIEACIEAIKKMILSAKSEDDMLGLLSELVNRFPEAAESIAETMEILKKNLEEEAQ